MRARPAGASRGGWARLRPNPGFSLLRAWNRKPLNGYKVVFVPFKNGKPAGKAEDFVIGFVNDKDQARGRPVGVAVDKSGALLIADDVGNTVWRVTADTEQKVSNAQPSRGR